MEINFVFDLLVFVALRLCMGSAWARLVGFPSHVLGLLVSWMQALGVRLEKMLVRRVLALVGRRARRLPAHIGFIMDGNRRFAERKMLAKRSHGHLHGFTKLEEASFICLVLYHRLKASASALTISNISGDFYTVPHAMQYNAMR